MSTRPQHPFQGEKVMKIHAIVALATAALCLAGPSFAQDAGKSVSANAAAVSRAMDNATTRSGSSR
jgi:hypothetical protein